MKYHIRVLDIKRRRNFASAEIAKNALKFLGSTALTEKAKHLLFLKYLKGNNSLRSSVAFIHNRCVITLRHVLYFVYFVCRVFKLSKWGLMDRSLV